MALARRLSFHGKAQDTCASGSLVLAAGFDPGVVDGIHDPNTVASLPVTGIVRDAEYRALLITCTSLPPCSQAACSRDGPSVADALGGAPPKGEGSALPPFSRTGAGGRTRVDRLPAWTSE